MKRTERLRRYCVGRLKSYVAKNNLQVPAPMLSFLLKYDIDEVIARIDALPIEENQQRKTRAA